MHDYTKMDKLLLTHSFRLLMEIFPRRYFRTRPTTIATTAIIMEMTRITVTTPPAMAPLLSEVVVVLSVVVKLLLLVLSVAELVMLLLLVGSVLVMELMVVGSEGTVM